MKITSKRLGMLKYYKRSRISFPKTLQGILGLMSAVQSQLQENGKPDISPWWPFPVPSTCMPLGIDMHTCSSFSTKTNPCSTNQPRSTATQSLALPPLSLLLCVSVEHLFPHASRGSLVKRALFKPPMWNLSQWHSAEGEGGGERGITVTIMLNTLT